MEISREGLTLGAGTVLAGMAKDEQGHPRVALADEPRAMALLATAYERQVEEIRCLANTCVFRCELMDLMSASIAAFRLSQVLKVVSAR
jgi:hypothetical protein